MFFAGTKARITGRMECLRMFQEEELILLVVAVVQFIFKSVLTQNNRGDRIYLMILETVLTPNLHLERLLASLSFSPTFLLSSITAFSPVFFGLSLFHCHFFYEM